VLADLGNRFLHSLDQLGRLVRDGPTETRIRGLSALASLLRLERANQTPELVSLAECWYRRVLGGQSAAALLAAMVKLPFPDLRLAAYGVLNTIVEQVSYSVC
jgi:26S proteasome non-ATPase regulatory subunit 5